MRTGPTSERSNNTSRPTTTRSTSGCALELPGVRLRGNVWLGEGVRDRRPRADRGPGVHRQLLPRSPPGRAVGPYTVLSPSVTLRESARDRRARVIDAGTLRRPQRASSRARSSARGVRRPLARPRARGRRDRRRGHDRRRGGDRRPASRIYPYKEIESGAADPREPDLGVARHRRASSARDGVAGLVNVDLTPEVGRPARGGARHRAQARRARRREPRVARASAG